MPVGRSWLRKRSVGLYHDSAMVDYREWLERYSGRNPARLEGAVLSCRGARRALRARMHLLRYLLYAASASQAHL